MEDLTGKQLGNYRVIGPLGEGGMAAVFKAFQPGTERYVALKVLPRQFVSDPGFVARFGQEARLIANLEHSNIVPVYDFGESDGYTFLVMRYVETGTLADVLQAGKVGLGQACHAIGQIGAALDYAHSRGVLHRDVKPSNVLIDGSGNCLLSDFGLAKMAEGSLHITQTGGILGTPAYMSPEQALGQPLDSGTDVYSLGIILYQMMTRRLPFVAETPMAVLMKHIRDPLPLPRAHDPALSEAVECVILKALAKERSERYQTAGEMARALRAAAGGQEAPLVSPSAGRVPAVLRADSGERERLAQAKAAAHAEAEKAAVQLHRYRRAKRTKASTIAIIGAGLLAPAALLLPFLMQQPPVDPPGAMAPLMLAVYVGFGYWAFRQWKRGRRMLQEVEADASREGKLYACQCGRPMDEYTAMHYTLCVVIFPWGLLSLLFKLKKCRECGRPYPGHAVPSA
jgi:hypothetical protein